MLKLRVLGCIELNGSNGQSIGSVLAQPKRLALLTYLALCRGFCRKDVLLPLFWPDGDQEHARAALRQQVYLLRRSLGADVIAGRGDDEIGIPEGTIWCDAVEFREMLGRGELENALEHSSGDLLPGFFLDGAPEFEHWLTAERARLRDEAGEAARTLAERADAAGECARAIHWTRRQLLIAPADEVAQRRLLVLLARSGDRAGAIVAYEEFVRDLENEYGLKPSAETQELAEKIRSGDGSDFLVPPAPADGARPTATQDDAGAGKDPRALARTTLLAARRAWGRLLTGRRRQAAVVGALILAIGAGMTALMGAPAPGSPVLVVGEIRDLTGGRDPSIAPAAEEMLTTQLAQLRELRVLSDSRVEQFREPERADGRSLAVAARKAGATDLVEGILYRLNDGRLRLDLQRINLASGTVRALQSIEGPDVAVLVRLAVLRLATTPRDSLEHAASASVAVLPFLDVSPDRRIQYLADGLTIDLINALGRVPGLWVASRRSSFGYRGVNSEAQEVGRNLGVRYILEGSVSREGDRLRANLQLVDVADGHLLWSHPFTGRQSDVFALQEQMERTTVQVLRSRLGLRAPSDAPRRPRNAAAYDAYLRGRFLLREKTQERVYRAIDYFSTAAAKDPDYALAYAGLADAYVALAAFECPDSVLPRARAAIDHALRLDDELAGMHLARANILLHFDWQWAAAEREHRRALQLDSGLPEAHFGYASYLRAARRPEEALQHIHQAMALRQAASPDTLAFAVVKNLKLSEFLYYAHRYPEARAHARASLDLDPGSVEARVLVALIHVQEGNFANAVAEVEAVRNQVTDRTAELVDIGYVYARTGRTAEARRILNTLQALSRTRYVPRDQMAMIYLGLGQTDLALDRFEAALADRHWALVYLNADPRLDPLRSNPRFQRLMRRIHAPS